MRCYINWMTERASICCLIFASCLRNLKYEHLADCVKREKTNKIQQSNVFYQLLDAYRSTSNEAVMGLFAGEVLILPLEGLIIFVLHHQISP